MNPATVSQPQDEHSKKLMDSIKLCESNFIELIRNRFGIVVHVNQANELSGTILNSCREFNLEPQDYLEKLSTCDKTSILLERLIIGITIGETYFFRDKRQMRLLEHILLPRIIKNKREKNDLSIHIWSAGCSTGEEIFTILMLLYEILPDHAAWSLDLMGTDINKKALQKITTGKYSQWSMRSIPDYYKERYFHKIDKNEYLLTPDIRDKVKFQYLNLNENDYPSLLNGTHSKDLILCRNVLIYFDRQRISQIMKKLSAALVEGGYLMLGASDPININDSNLTFYDEDGIYFSRVDNNLPYSTTGAN